MILLRNMMILSIVGTFVLLNCMGDESVAKEEKIQSTTKSYENEKNNTLPIPISSSSPITTTTIELATNSSSPTTEIIDSKIEHSNLTSVHETTHIPETTEISTKPTTITVAAVSETTTEATTTSTRITPTAGATTTTSSKPTATATISASPCRRFDLPSFIGGIVLTLGLLAISLIAYKFYKAHNERNYHTL